MGGEREELKLEIGILGEFQVSANGRAIPSAAWEHRRAADLVKLLALSRGFRVARDTAIDALCPSLAPDAGAAALHKAASHARSVLRHRGAIVLRGGEVALGGRVIVDAQQFEEAARTALASGDPDACTRAAAEYAGELLPSDRFAGFTEEPRRRLEALHVDLLRRAGAWAEVVSRDPTDESAHLALMRLYARSGHRAAALRQFRRLRETLARELGVGPSPDAVALLTEITRGPAVRAPLQYAAPIVGREVELARARVLLRTVGEGRGATLFVRGDAGIGKTRFCEALLAEAAQSGATTLRGEAHADEGSAPYAPVMQALDRLLTERSELAERLTESGREVIARLRVTAAGSLSEGAPIGRQRVLGAVTQLLGAAAKERPIVLFVDDLHTADASTLDLLLYIARWARTEPVLLLAAFRAEAAEHLKPLRSALLDQRRAVEIELANLSRAECRALIVQLTGDAPDETALDAVFARAEGHPFFTEMLAPSVRSGGIAEVPAHLYDVVSARLARLDDALVRALSRAAILGELIRPEELIGLLDVNETAAFALLDRALAERLIDEAAGGYRFHHALLREVLVRAMPAHRRRETHREAARALVAAGGSAAAIAHHLREGGAAQDSVPWLLQAARDEASVGAYRTALAYAESALAISAHVDVIAMRAQILFAMGDPSCVTAFEHAIKKARGVRRNGLRIALARAYFQHGDIERGRRVIAEVEEPEDDLSLAQYLLTRAQLSWAVGDIDAAEVATSRARAIAERTGEQVVMTEVVLGTAVIAHSQGRWPDRVVVDLFEPERAADVALAVHEGHLCVAEFYLYGGEPYSKLEAFALELRDRADKSGARRALAFATCLLGETALLTGELSRAAEHLEQSRRLSLEVGSAMGAALATQRLAECALAGGNRAAARAFLREALELSRRSPAGLRHLLQRVWGTMVRAADDAPAALAIVDEAELAIVGPGEGCFGCMITFAVPAALACARAGALDRAREYAGAAERVVPMFWRGGSWYAALAEIRGVLARAEGRDAEPFFREAAEGFAAVGQRLDSERCRRALEQA